MFDLTRIEATLKYGQFDSTKRKYLIVSFALINVLLISAMIIIIYYISYQQLKNINPLPVVNFVFGIIGVTFGFSFILAICLFYFIKNEKARHEILLWLEDAIELIAFCKQIGVSTETEHEFSTSPATIRIQLNFKYNAKKFTIKSGEDNKRNGYKNLWKRYANQSVHILFSPKYNQVMFLKQN